MKVKAALCLELTPCILVFFDQVNMKNPYQAGVDEVGIGAFALLPSQQNQGAIWLRDFFKSAARKLSTFFTTY